MVFTIATAIINKIYLSFSILDVYNRPHTIVRRKRIFFKKFAPPNIAKYICNKKTQKSSEYCCFKYPLI